MRWKTSNDMNIEWKKAFRAKLINRMSRKRLNEAGYCYQKAKVKPLSVWHKQARL